MRRHLSSVPSHSPTALPRRVLISSLQVHRRTSGDGCTVLSPVGELESATVPRFRQAIAELGSGQRVVLDMAGVPFLDSSGIGALIGAVRRVRELGGSIAIAAVCPPVQRVLNLTGIDRIVEVTETVEQARALLDADEGEPPAPRAAHLRQGLSFA